MNNKIPLSARVMFGLQISGVFSLALSTLIDSPLGLFLSIVYGQVAIVSALLIWIAAVFSDLSIWFKEVDSTKPTKM